MSATRRLYCVPVILLLGIVALAAAPGRIPASGPVAEFDNGPLAREQFWYFSADSRFEAYLTDFEIADDLPVRLVEVEICRYLDGQHHLTEARVVMGVQRRDIYCEFRVAGHVVTAQVTSLQRH